MLIGFRNGRADITDLSVGDGPEEEGERSCGMAAKGKTQNPEQSIVGKSVLYVYIPILTLLRFRNPTF